jgi:hypothetical protein
MADRPPDFYETQHHAEGAGSLLTLVIDKTRPSVGFDSVHEKVVVP